jgi:hypothetical protein
MEKLEILNKRIVEIFEDLRHSLDQEMVGPNMVLPKKNLKRRLGTLEEALVESLGARDGFQEIEEYILNLLGHNAIMAYGLYSALSRAKYKLYLAEREFCTRVHTDFGVDEAAEITLRGVRRALEKI